MAPIRPRNRQPHRSSNTLITTHSPASTKPIFHQVNPHTHAPAKILKRRSKHSELLSRLHATHPPKRSGITKRRRAGRKTPLTSLAGLGDALPDADDDDEREWEGFEDDGRGGSGSRGRRRRMKSMKTAKGSMKRREKAMVAERERFARNLKVLVGGERAAEGKGLGESGEQGGSNSERWKAIRGFIEGNGEGREV